MLKTIAVIFGGVFTAVGILGFMPGITTQDHLLLGIFHVNVWHNLVHLITGLVALWAGLSTESASRMFFQVFGVLYGVIAILGFYQGDGMLMGFMANNMADVMLHSAVAVFALALGWIERPESLFPHQVHQ